MSLSPILLVVDVKDVKDYRFLRLLNKTLNYSGTQMPALHLMAFEDDHMHELESQVREIWAGDVQVIDTTFYFDKINMRMRDSMSSFVSGLREKLGHVAADINRNWAESFRELWWYSEISEKNSPSEPVWWEIFRFSAIRERLSEIKYSDCYCISGKVLNSLLRQICTNQKINYRSSVVYNKRFFCLRIILWRVIVGISLIYTLFYMKLKYNKRSREIISSMTSENKILVYTFFPRCWTKRFGTYMDMYYGQTINELENKYKVMPVYVFPMYCDNYVRPVRLMEYFEKLENKNMRPDNFLILETFGKTTDILRAYLSFRDILLFWRMTFKPQFRKAFVYEGIDFRNVFLPLMWKSAIVSWPHMKIKESQTKNLSKMVNPDLTVLYCFEYILMRAVVKGIRKGCDSKILGIQHGPITTMKLLYSGKPEELKQTTQWTIPLPEPDIYAVDGTLARGILKQRGIPPEKIKITGPARFDNVFMKARESYAPNRLQNEKVSILVAPGLHDTQFVVEFILRALHGDSGLKIIIKPHPKISGSTIQRIVNRFLKNGDVCRAEIKIVRKGEIYDWMKEADIFVSTYSSTGVEAIAFGLPVILLKSRKTPDMSMFYYDNSPVLTASDAKELRNHIERIIKDANYSGEYSLAMQKALYNNFGETDSHAAERLAELCYGF